MSSYNSWSYNGSSVQPSISLAQEVETWGRLELPPANNPPPLNSIDRFITDVPTGVIVTRDTQNLCPPPRLVLHGGVAFSNPGSNYQRSSQDQGDNDSLQSDGSDHYYGPFGPSEESSRGSTEEYHQPSSTSTSPEYNDSTFGKPWVQHHPYMQPTADLNAPVDPNLAPNDFVCPKEVHISPCRDGRSQERTDDDDDDAMGDGEDGDYQFPEPMPTIVFPQCYNRQYYQYEQPPPPIGTYPQQPDHSLQHDHSCSSAQASRQSSPGRGLKLKAIKVRKSKCPADMMRPFNANSCGGGKPHKGKVEKPRGRGVGKKMKEKKVCRDHPEKIFAHASDYKKHINQQHLRPFLCVFYFAGCNQTFGSKNEWKRHVFSQHLQISYWPCDDPLCNDRKAIFNRKDLFGQHLKRMHPPPEGTKASTQRYMEEVIDRCRVERRKPPQNSRCGYCKQTFSGPQSWDQRMEHVGQHYEKNNYKGISRDRWVPDEGLIAWALEHGIIELNDKGDYTIVATGKDAIVKAGVEHKKLAKEELARERRYAGDDGDDDDERDAEGDDEFLYP
ncbi:hypothetical protein L873DRAFT_447619 [Choiromyces venosus 120613-1]|uniref:C2H2-type domain-containing protein n=1 Tax=Choiromyces venosus 120613-1 TaxID=1336337 RepID=A0A3N4JYG2_9PEZI|nr:hypothetical protein L873DRAFT_447619 [Choiromyces venosus 120613-1]